ncbi:MAG: carbonic anhydrase [Verrucomicrobiales bacterium]|jgi:carbonic anhydrase
MKELVEGVHRFQSTVFPEKAQLFAKLAGGQAPHTLLITCSDSRIDPSLLLQTEPGDIFVDRNPGNIVPAADPEAASNDGSVASIEFAIVVLGVSQIVVCGHSDCRAMTSLLRGGTSNMPAVDRWLEHSATLVEASDPDEIDDFIEQNVLLQLEHLRTHELVAEAISKGLTLEGWIYEIGTGDVRRYDGEGFVSL